MIIRPRFAALMPLLVTGTLGAQSAPSFEGIVRYRMVVEGTPVETIYMAKGTKTRSETRMGDHSMITVQDATTFKTMLIMPESRTYSVIDADVEAPSKLIFKRLGTKSRVLGHECEDFHYEIEEATIRVCAAKGMGVLQAGAVLLSTTSGPPAMRAIAAKNPEFARALREGFLPLKISFSGTGEPATTMTAVSVERKAVDASLFAAPAGYEKSDTPGVPNRLIKP